MRQSLGKTTTLIRAGAQTRPPTSTRLARGTWKKGLDNPSSFIDEFGAHGRCGRTRTASLLLTKEVLGDQFSIGAPRRSNPAAVAHNRCLAALPSKCHIFASVNPFDAQTLLCSLERALAGCHPVRIDQLSAIPAPLSGSAAPGQLGARRSPGGEITSPSAKTHRDACNHTTATGPLTRLVGADGLA